MCTSAFGSMAAFADSVKTEVIEEIERKEIKSFCAKKSGSDAKKQCEDWLAVQKKSLGDRLLTAYCSPADMASGKVVSCLYESKGEVKYILKKYKVETISR
jgi:hypothetical protein